MLSLALFPLLFSPILGREPADIVNLFIGTTNGGNVFPGQYLYLKCAHISTPVLGTPPKR